MYLTEIASKELRGSMGVLHQCGVVLGILAAQVFSNLGSYSQRGKFYVEREQLKKIR